jgi:hypothetical protein
MALTYGRRPPKKAPAMRFSTFHTGQIPEPPAAPAEHLGTLGDCRVGDCNAVAWADTRLVASALAGAAYHPTQEQVWDFYRTQNPGFDPGGTAGDNGPGSAADRGMELQTGLEYLRANDGPDGVRAVAFAQVDPANPKEVEAAIAIFGSLWLGILVERSDVDGPPAPVLGTDIAVVAWGPEAAPPSFRSHTRNGQRLVEEAWIVIWPEHLGRPAFLEGVDQAALRQAYRDLTGRTLALPA